VFRGTSVHAVSQRVARVIQPLNHRPQRALVQLKSTSVSLLLAVIALVQVTQEISKQCMRVDALVRVTELR
jgi:hypothetical protein